MKIALIDAWPNSPTTAEREFILRFQIALMRLGIDSKRVITSQEIDAYAPDAVIVTHEFSPKLTAIPTIGILWSPLSFFAHDPYRLKSIRSWDGYLVGSPHLRRFLSDLQSALPIHKPISQRDFLPTSVHTNIFALEQAEVPTVAYVGAHWDGERHDALFRQLAVDKTVTFYGPKESWRHVGPAYGGPITFDGHSVTSVLSKHGLVLCLHHDAHRSENIPSMRTFEALSIGALPIIDQIPFALDELADIALFLNTDQPVEAVKDDLLHLIAWVQEHPKEACARARHGKEWFDRHWTLEGKIKDDILPLLETVMTQGMFYHSAIDQLSTSKNEPICEIILSFDAKNSDLEVSINSIISANSFDFPLSIIFIVNNNNKEAFEHLSRLVNNRIQFRLCLIPQPSHPAKHAEVLSSSILWAGLHTARAPFVAALTPGCEVFANHFRQLGACLEARPASPLAYSGFVRREWAVVEAPNFCGPLNQIIPEFRTVERLATIRLTDMAGPRTGLLANTWMARREMMLRVIGDDPMFAQGEHIYLGMLAAQIGKLTFTGSATVVSDEQVGAIDPSLWKNEIAPRFERRLAEVSFPTELRYAEFPPAEPPINIICPRFSFLSEGDFYQLDIWLPITEKISNYPLKLQKNGQYYSLEVPIIGFADEIGIPKAYIENIDRAPLMRIYFSDDLSDMRDRYAALPKRIRQQIHLLKRLSPQAVRFDNHVEPLARNILTEVQGRLRSL